MSIDAMKQALAALEEINQLSIGENAICLPAEIDGAMDALRERLAQPEQEPVAWQVMVEDEAMKEFPIKDMAHDWCAKKKLSGSPSAYWIRPLYTAPRQWQGLTDEEIVAVYGDDLKYRDGDYLRYSRAIEAKLREKNT